MKKGENLIRLGRGPSGIKELLRAAELKPDYWPPYAAISDYYKKNGDLKDAREVLEKGLSASPDAKALKERLANLDTVKK
jgi:tetratricopeptide (TPR) repeat protein